MTEQEQIISDFKAKCQEIILKHSSGKFENSAVEDIYEEMEAIINRHSNMPNIDAEKLKEDLNSISKFYLGDIKN